MIPVRVLTTGSPEACTPWVGLARKLARQCWDAGVLQRVYQVADGVRLRVENVIPSSSLLSPTFGAVCKVWIEAGSSGGFQFYTTSPTVQWAVDSGMSEFFPAGSVVYVPTPHLVLNGAAVDYTRTLITAIPCGSTVESGDRWSTVPMNGLVRGEGGLAEAMYRLFPVKNAWQVDGIPQSVYYATKTTTEAPSSSATPRVQPTHRLMSSWVQAEGQVYGYGAYFPLSLHYVTDTRYDAPPSTVKGKGPVKHQAPDTDWFGRACTQVVGSRRFVILHDAKGDWYCWPDNAPLDPIAYLAEYGAYAEQAYKANVVPASAKKFTPSYPSWVAPELSWRDAYRSAPLKQHFSPRYAASFNATGTKAIMAMVERKTSEATFFRTDYTPAALNALPPITPPRLPVESEIDAIQVDASWRYGGTHNPQDLAFDRIGWVAFDLQIEIVGNDDFTFEVAIANAMSPDEVLGLGKGALASIAYARALDWSEATLATLGPPLTGTPVAIATDDVLSVFVELYQHQDDIDLVKGYFGEPSRYPATKAKAVFYKGLDFGQTLFRLALSQRHGHGYTYAPTDGGLAATPHPFVWNPTRTMLSRYPYTPKDGCAEAQYYYSGSLEQLDLSTLSFYYITRLVEETREPTPYRTDTLLERRYAYHKLLNRAKTVCTVCVMGRIVESPAVGHDDLPTSWILGWQRQAGDAPLDDDEALIQPGLMGNIAGIGHAAISSLTGNLEAGQNNWHHTSWINSGSLAQPWSRFHQIASFPWWLLGPSGHVARLALTLAVMKAWHGSSATYPAFPDDITLTYPTPAKHLFAMERGDMEAFAGFIWDLYSTFIGTTDSVEYRLSDTYSASPLSMARSGMTREAFAEEVAGYLWVLVQHLQALLPATRPSDETEGSGTAAGQGLPLPLFGCMVLPRGGGLVIGNNDYNGIIEDEHWLDLFEKRTEIRSMELGAMYYAQAIHQHIYPRQTALQSAMVLTPEGHLSYSRKDLYDIKKTFWSQVVVYFKATRWHVVDPVPSFFILDDVPDPNMVPSDVDWKSVDGLSWYYGKVKTKHLWMYNLAYQPVQSVKALHSDEAMATPYSDDDFRPEFKFTYVDGFRWFYPLYRENGEYQDFQLMSLAKEAGFHYTAPSDPDLFEDRPYRKFIRLSPMFF